MGKIEAVLFDMDGVLVDSEEANFVWISSVIEEYGYPKPKKEDYLPVFGIGRHDVIKALTKEGSEEKIKEVMALADRKKDTYPVEMLKMREGAVEVLKMLSGNYKLGIVTSGSRNSVERMFGIADIRKYFGTVVTIEDCAERKPSPEGLLIAARRLTVSPKTMVYVGDRDVDVMAGHAAGMKVIGFSKEGIADADANASEFEEIPEIIKRFDS